MAARDYYDVLGVDRSASAEQIKRAHRKLALQFHPDRNKAKDAQARFAEIQRAYEVLSDEGERRRYDEFIQLGGSPEAFGNPAAAGGAGGGGPFRGSRSAGPGQGAEWTQADSATFDTIFGDIFGGGARGGRGARASRSRARERMTVEVSIPLELALKGGRHTVHFDGERHELEIPAGIEDDEVLGISGRVDLLARVRIGEHPWLRREGRDLSYDLPLSIVEATLGTSVDAPIPGGGTVVLKIPPGTASGRKLRIAGKGFPGANGRSAGDLLVVVQIAPPKEPDQLTRQLLGEIAGRIENPRARIGHLRP